VNRPLQRTREGDSHQRRRCSGTGRLTEVPTAKGLGVGDGGRRWTRRCLLKDTWWSVTASKNLGDFPRTIPRDHALRIMILLLVAARCCRAVTALPHMRFALSTRRSYDLTAVQVTAIQEALPGASVSDIRQAVSRYRDVNRAVEHLLTRGVI